MFKSRKDSAGLQKKTKLQKKKLCEVVATRQSLEHCHTPLATG